jgi:hypothetical protein
MPVAKNINPASRAADIPVQVDFMKYLLRLSIQIIRDPDLFLASGFGKSEYLSLQVKPIGISGYDECCSIAVQSHRLAQKQNYGAAFVFGLPYMYDKGV